MLKKLLLYIQAKIQIRQANKQIKNAKRIIEKYGG